MKKIIMFLVMGLLMTGCNTNELVKEDENKKQKKVEEKSSNDYVDNNPIKLGLYVDKRLSNEYQIPWVRLKEICVIETYFTQDVEIKDKKQKEAWEYYYNSYQNIRDYKIGYEISFTAEGKDFRKTILTPNDIDDFFYYVQLYLYDDIHQEENAYYSHLTTENYNNETLISSIKIVGGSGIEFVESDIVITAFTYTDNDFDENNNYRGKSKYTITIKNN